MSKRFHDTEIWEEDWFIAIPRDYRDLWLYVKDSCDHSGIWRPNVSKFNKLYDCNVDTKKALELLNKDKQRIRVLDSGRWFIEDFIAFQYGDHLNLKNRVHLSIINLLKINNIKLTSIRGLNEDTEGVKDKDQDKDKDKDKDKDNIKASPNNNINVTKEERQKLIDTYGPGITKEYVERLIDYAAQFPAKFKRYASHYATIRNWMRRDNVKKLPPKPQAPKEELRYDPKVAELTKATVKAMK